jgi:hypothetical protein
MHSWRTEFPASHLPAFNMSQPSIAASIGRILNIATNLARSLKLQYMRDRSPEHNQLYLEITVLQDLLKRAYSKAGDSNNSAYWFSSMQSLTCTDGGFDQTTEVLESLACNLGGRAWPFDQEEAKRIWGRIRRTNTLIDFALDSVVSRFFHMHTTDTDADLAGRVAKRTKQEMGESLERLWKTERRIKSEQRKRRRVFG